MCCDVQRKSEVGTKLLRPIWEVRWAGKKINAEDAEQQRNAG